MSKEGSPISGADGAGIVIRKANGAIGGTFGYFNPALLTTTPTAYEFTNTDITYKMQHDDKIEVDWISGNSSNKIVVQVTNGSKFTGGQCVTYDGSTFSGASYANQDADLVGTFYSTN